MKTTTTIGSLPHKNTEIAVELIMKNTPDLPTWPQLPKRDFFENMVVQYSENFPGIVIDKELQKIYVNAEKALSDMEGFYENYLNGNLDYFSISQKYAAGFYSFLKHLTAEPLSRLTAVKCQTVGPITYAMMLKDEHDRCVFFNEQLRDAATKLIIMKSVWQIKKISEQVKTNEIILFLDEPYLSAYGSAFTAISRDEVTNSLQEVISGIRTSFNLITQSLNHSISLRIGVHCCGNTDWSLLLDSEIDILSFDAYGYFDNLLLYVAQLKNFLDRGGILAWGIVPTAAELIASETLQNLRQLMEKHLETLKTKGIDTNKLNQQMIITPSCGMGSLSEEPAEKVLTLTKEISEML